MNRDAYRKLMALNSTGADSLLSSKFEELDKSIRSADNIDELIKQLSALEQFAFKFSDKTVSLMKHLLDREPIQPKKYSTKFGKLEGKSYGEVISKSLDILNQLRYYQTPSILAIYHDLFVKGLKRQVEDKIKALSSYNLDALEHLGYRPQVDIMDYFKNVKLKTEPDIDFFIEATTPLGSTEGEVHKMKDEITLLYGFAPLPYNDQLESIRTWLFGQYENLLTSHDLSLSNKLKVVELLNSMVYGMARGEPSEELAKLLKENEDTLFSTYNRILFSNNELTAPLPIALEINEKLLFIKKRSGGKLPQNAQSILDTLSADYSYQIYDTLFGDKLDRIDSGETYTVVEARTKKEREELLSSIDSPTHPVIPVLAQIAEFIGELDDWKLNNYYWFIVTFAKDKPKLAVTVLLDAKKSDSRLIKAAGQFLWGFREAGADKEYVEAMEVITDHKLLHSLPQVAYSLGIGDLTDSDLDVAEELIDKSGSFSFIKADAWPNYLHALTGSLARRLSTNNQRVNSLFLRLLEVYDKYQDVYLGALDLGMVRSEFGIKSFDTEIKSALLQNLLTVGNLSHDHQNILLAIVDDDTAQLFDFFTARIEHAEKHTSLRRSYEYDAVPYHLNDELLKLVSETVNYKDLFFNLLDNFSTKWSYRNAETAQLLKQLGGYKQPLLDYINQTNKDGLKKVVLFCHSVEPIDSEVALEIIKHTNDKSIWSSVSSLLYATGVVSGEYGIAHAHEARRDELKTKYLNSDDANVREFAELEIRNLDEAIRSEIRRTDEDKRISKIEFEH